MPLSRHEIEVENITWVVLNDEVPEVVAILAALPDENVDDVCSGAVGAALVSGRHIKRVCNVMVTEKCHINRRSDVKLNCFIQSNDGRIFIHSITLVQKKTIKHQTII